MTFLSQVPQSSDNHNAHLSALRDEGYGPTPVATGQQLLRPADISNADPWAIAPARELAFRSDHTPRRRRRFPPCQQRQG